MTPEQKQRIEQIEARLAKLQSETNRSISNEQYVAHVGFLLSLVKSQEAPRMFPIQKGPAIPWDMAEIAYATYSRMYGTGQTLQRLADRGGFGWYEFLHLYFDDGQFKETGEAMRERWKSDVLKLQWEANTKKIHDAATSMRSACVEKVRKKASGYQADADNKSFLPNYRKQMAFAASALREAASELESVSI